MRLGFLLLFYSLFLLPPVAAQTTVSGRVLDARKNALYGVTVLQRNTPYGASSDPDGHFSLTVPGQPDSLELVVSSIGYQTQRLRVAAGSGLTIRLAEDTKVISCDVAVPKAEVGLASGLRYAPIGGRAQLSGFGLMRRPFTLSATYQTNLRRNYALSAQLMLPAVNRNNWHLREQLAYQRIQAAAARLRFTSYALTLSLDHTLRNDKQLPTVLLTGGFAHLRPLPAEFGSRRSGLGYGLGLEHGFLPYPFRLQVRALATRWPGYWQWQGGISHSVRKYTVGLSLNRLQQYREASLSFSRIFY